MRTRTEADRDPLTYTYPRSLRELDGGGIQLEGPKGRPHVLAFVGHLHPERRHHNVPVTVDRRRKPRPHALTVTWQQRLTRWLRAWFLNRNTPKGGIR